MYNFYFCSPFTVFLSPVRCFNKIITTDDAELNHQSRGEVLRSRSWRYYVGTVLFPACQDKNNLDLNVIQSFLFWHSSRGVEKLQNWWFCCSCVALFDGYGGACCWVLRNLCLYSTKVWILTVIFTSVNFFLLFL